MDNQLLFFTCAYNAEKTLSRAIDSIVNQTYSNWVYYVLDNGSTDGTAGIIREYERRDSRIHGLHVAVNDIANLFSTPFRKNKLLPDCEYNWLAILDADDEYAPTFAEKCLLFAHENSLDLVCVSCDMKHNGIRWAGTSADMVFDKASDYLDFPAWYKLAMPVWSKLYHRSVVDSMRANRINLHDGEIALEAFMQSHKAGSLSEILYRMRGPGIENESSAVPETESFWDFSIQLPSADINVGRRFFLEKCGTINKRSEDILFYRASIEAQGMITRIFGRTSAFWRERRLQCIKEIMRSQFMSEFLTLENYGCEMKNPMLLQTSRLNLLHFITFKLCETEERACALEDLFEKVNRTVIPFYLELIQAGLTMGDMP